MYITILAGGTGKRLWPISRQSQPKQAGCFFDEKTLLQLTYERILKGFIKKDIYISCGENQFNLLNKQVKANKNHFILEPEAKGTAMAIGLACIKLLKKDPQAILGMVNADHFIKEEAKYIQILKAAEKLIKQNPQYLSLIGIKPDYPETGYGYIEQGNLFGKIGNQSVYKIKKFKEKPDLKIAQKYIQNKKYLWNPAWFVFRADTMLNLFKKYLPQHYKSLKNIEQKIGTKKESQVLIKEFKKVENICINYGIMEKAKKMLLIPSSIVWNDIGSWQAVQNCFAKSESANLAEGNNVLLNGHGNLIINKEKKKIITLSGLDNVVVINTPDALLICDKNKSQDVKKILTELKKKKLRKYL